MLVPSRFTGAGGRPRFTLPIPRGCMADVAVRVLVGCETGADGYESAPRCFFDAHLRPGDVFVDVGAHFGIFALTAASRWPGRVGVVAIEPHPENLARLREAVAFNGLDGSVEVVGAACANRPGTARLRLNTSMGHTIAAWTPIAEVAGPRLHVPVVTLDGLFAARPELAGRRVFLKVDVEGAEAQVLAGARRLLRSGRVAAVVWEYGLADARPAERGRAVRVLRALERLGFASYHFPEGGRPPFALAPLPDLSAGGFTCNVLSLAPSCAPLAAYARA